MAKLILTVEEARDRNLWAFTRAKGIGGSDIAAILGMSRWKSAFGLWLEKTGQAEAPDLSENEAVYWGTVLEDAVAQRFCELTGKRVRRCGTLADDEYPFMHANVDRMIVGENAGLECKTTGAFGRSAWDGDEVPDAYYLQCQWYMMVTGCERWYIACLIGGNKFVWKEIPRNDSDIAAIRKAAVDFWHKVENRIMPEVDGSKECGATLAERFPQDDSPAVELDGSADEIISELNEVSALVKDLTERKTLAENKLKALLGSAECGESRRYRVKWSTVKGRASLDSKALQVEMPAVYEKYVKVGKPSRRLTIKEMA